jgi:hypothetical protein
MKCILVWQIKIQEEEFWIYFFVFMYIAYDQFYEIALVIDYPFLYIWLCFK